MGFTSMIVRALVGLVLSAAIITPVSAIINEQDFAADDIIIRDVCILGGGSTGTYAAVSLKDQGKTVVVVEREKILGGHTHTLYVDNYYVDYGVEGVFNNELTVNYFNHLEVPYKPLLPGTLINQYVDFKTGKKVLPASGILSEVAAATLYRLAIQKYSYLQDGLYNLPDPVPEELLRPFGEFVEKTGIQSALQLIFVFCHSAGDVLNTPLLNILQLFGIPHVDAFLEGGYITPKNGMYQLYERASEALGSDVLYQSTVSETERSDSGVKVVVQSANGERKLIKAKQLLITFVPYMDNLQGFDLVEAEASVFQKWNWNTYYIAVVNNTGIPNNVNVVNTDPSKTPGYLPLPPFQWALQYLSVDGYLASKIVGDSTFTEADARELVLSDLRRMQSAGTYPGNDPEIVAFGSHSPEMLSVSNADIQDGFYRKMYALQGIHSTFYTGLTFCSDYSALLWAYTETVVQRMLLS